jgi:hypothetical protein
MAKYLLRAVKQVVVLELTGKEKVVDAETEAQLNLRAREFLIEEFPDAGPDVELQIKRVGGETPITSKVPADFNPQNRAKTKPGAPF